MKTFRRSLLFGAVCGLALFGHSVSAEEPTNSLPHFYPAKAWEIGSIKAVVTDYSGECIVQNEFNNGFLLQINGSSNWVQQLNLNIRQSAFTVGDNYDVSLIVPGIAQETISSIANRANIISVPLKGQKELYKAMRDHGVLDVKVEGNTFRFFLTGFNKVSNQFERCMAGAAPGVVAAKNVRGDFHDEPAPQDIVIESKSSDIVVTSDALSESEKSFLVNESIAFEKQEVDLNTEIKEKAEAEEALESLTAKIEDDKKAQDIIQEEDAVAALNASAIEAFNAPAPKNSEEAPVFERVNNESVAETDNSNIKIELAPSDSEGKGELSDTPVEDESQTIEKLDDTPSSDDEVSFNTVPNLIEPSAGDATQDIGSPEADVILSSELLMKDVEDTRDVEKTELSALDIPLEVQDIADVASAPIMPNSDVQISEALLAEPENSIDMPKIKVKKEFSEGRMDFSQAKIENANTKALARIAALENELAKARAENVSLHEELKVSLKEAQEEVRSIESDNWNLERATKRFHEVERQMKSLGMQLQKERAQWAVEKQEIELMLFDPELTSQEQLAKLSRLEKALDDANTELEQLRASKQ
ncbi:MAG: hypothetical protein AB8B83_08150 [Bdellovibrionales bacterium]